MPQNRQSFKLSKDGAVAVANGVDRYQCAFSGDITTAVGVVGTAPTGAALTATITLDGTVLGTLTIAAGATEGTVDLTDTTFSSGQTVALNVTQVGSTVAGSDLDVTVQYNPR